VQCIIYTEYSKNYLWNTAQLQPGSYYHTTSLCHFSTNEQHICDAICLSRKPNINIENKWTQVFPYQWKHRCAKPSVQWTHDNVATYYTKKYLGGLISLPYIASTDKKETVKLQYIFTNNEGIHLKDGEGKWRSSYYMQPFHNLHGKRVNAATQMLKKPSLNPCYPSATLAQAQLSNAGGAHSHSVW